ncbi:MAG: cell wall hydrolase [Clostridia bacterium]|nr:cell wall hydrolase [Clostridia bacterium]
MNKITRLTLAVLASVMMVGTAANPIGAKSDEDYRLVYDGIEYEGRTFTVEGHAYVSLREFACTVDNAVVTWDGQKMTSTVETESLLLHAKDGSYYIDANGRILWCEKGVFTKDGVLYVPVRQAAQAFGFSASYSAEDHTTTLTRRRGAILSDEEYYDKDDLYWLAKIIHAESQGEPFLGKLAVGSVILNRVDSDEFPDTIYDVIFDDEHGVQFTPTVDGAIEQTAGKDSVLAAKICLENTRLSHEILYFLNEAAATNFWIVENCRFVLSIGCHDFYAP